MFEQKLTERAKSAINLAGTSAMEMGHNYIGTEHLLLGLVREVLGSGSAFGFKFIEGDGILAFVLAPGAFLALGYLIVIFRKLTTKKAE